jgi:pimeloyl-ACP methyl ester carboxylesterase
MANDDEVDLYWEEFGEGQAVLFVHGFPLDHRIWLPLVDPLEGRCRLILPDLRGFGRSPKGNVRLSIDLMARDIARLMDKLGLGHAILVGHSMGGYVALSFAHQFPQRVSGLGLISTQARADTAERRQGRYQTAKMLEERGIEVVSKGMPGQLTSNRELAAQLETLITGLDVQTLAEAQVAMAERAEASPWLVDVRVPALVVLGEEDQLTPLENQQEMAGLLPDAELVSLPGCGHMPMMEAPAEVARALLGLMERVAQLPRATGN